MDGSSAGRGPSGRPRRVDRSLAGERLRAVLPVAARALGVLAGLGVAAELLVDLLRAGIGVVPVAALGAVALVAAGAVVLGGRAGAGERRRGRPRPAAPPSMATLSRRALRWQRRLGGAEPDLPDGGVPARPGRRERRRRGRGPTTSRDG